MDESSNITIELEEEIYNYGINCGNDKNFSSSKIIDLLEFNSELIINNNLHIQTLRNIFLRGYFDSTVISFSVDYNDCYFIIDKKYFKYIPTSFSIFKYSNTSKEDNLDTIIIKGCNVIEFMDALYKDANLYNKINKKIYNTILNRNLGNSNKITMFYKMNKNAVSPSKNRITDSGYDMYIIEKIKQKNNLYMYDTGIIVQPPAGIYFDLVPRSSIIKKGYMLANSVGIIDQTFRGTIKVALIKIDPDAEELELPLKLVQLIPRQVIQMEVCEIKNENEIISTVRESGEFGSTDKKILTK